MPILALTALIFLSSYPQHVSYLGRICLTMIGEVEADQRINQSVQSISFPYGRPNEDGTTLFAQFWRNLCGLSESDQA